MWLEIQGSVRSLEKGNAWLRGWECVTMGSACVDREIPKWLRCSGAIQHFSFDHEGLNCCPRSHTRIAHIPSPANLTAPSSPLPPPRRPPRFTYRLASSCSSSGIALWEHDLRPLRTDRGCGRDEVSDGRMRVRGWRWRLRLSS